MKYAQVDPTYRGCQSQPQDFTNPLLERFLRLANYLAVSVPCLPGTITQSLPPRPQLPPGWGRFFDPPAIQK